jgi:MHS family proline/betaine transporter-like MFS transporter
MPVRQSAPRASQIAAAVIGNALEWYDFLIFGYLTVVISRLFFPSDTQYASLLLTTATFGVGFFMRLVGGILLGLYAGRKGRKPALMLIIALRQSALPRRCSWCWRGSCRDLRPAASSRAPPLS